jgi:phosphotransferase system enzyme I (PtsI)
MMIEVPSAAVLADSFAREVNFFSIGTNDLVQYTLAVDRDNEHVAHIFSPVDPAVLRLIKQTVIAADRAGIEVAMCGEMAGDILYSILLVGLGLKSLSMAPTAIADVKRLVCSVSYEGARRVADRVMQMASAQEAEQYLREETSRSVPELIELDERD